jgi:UDPglucose 6-dehydrogenase
MSKIGVIGLGYVGISTALGLGSQGHNVFGLDTDSKKISSYKNKVMPFIEQGMDSLLEQLTDSGNLVFTDSWENFPGDLEFYFVCVPTPSTKDGDAEMAYFDSAIISVSELADPGSCVIIKSTVPIGTAEKTRTLLESKQISLANNPEFLREGTALEDFLSPDRIVVGSASDNIADHVLGLFSNIKTEKLKTTLTSAETIKYSANSFLALKLSFVNEIARLCESTGADVSEVMKGIGQDHRIGSGFLSPGPGWGGSCFPKDVRELISLANSKQVNLETVKAALASNIETQNHIIDRSREAVGGSLESKRVAILGLAFKAHTDDLRDSPAIEIARKLLSEGASITAYDPAITHSKLEKIDVVPTALEACQGADLVMFLTEWPEFSELNAQEILAVVSHKRVIDCRRVLDYKVWSEHSNYFWTVGREL